MKKLLTAMVLMMTCIATLAGCKTSRMNKSLDGKRILVLYFSRAGENYMVGNVKKGNTAFLAGHIAEATGADVFEIKSKKDYNLSYEQMLNVVREEWQKEEYPPYEKKMENAKDYDVVFVGGPIWWGTFPRVVLSFLRDHDLNGKTIIPFTTNEGSGLGETPTHLAQLYPQAHIVKGFTMSGQEARKPEAKEVVTVWLKALDINAPATASIDGKTGATEMHVSERDSTANKTQTVEIAFPDGRTDHIELTVGGTVDMSDGILWGASNVGANHPWEVGSHFAWGENHAKEEYTEDTYSHLHKNIGKQIEKTWYDAARKQMGGQWRMPTRKEWHNMLYNTTHEWGVIHGQQGYLFTAKNGARLFFPANGYKYGTETFTPDEGYYWTSTVSDEDNAYVTYLPSNSWGMSNYSRYVGIGIRPVKSFQ